MTGRNRFSSITFLSALLFAALGLTSGLVLPASVQAELTVTFQSIDPPISRRTEGIPPQPGVQLFVFDTGGQSIPQQYTAVFQVSELPATAVLTACKLGGYTYDSGSGELTLTFEHVGYVPNSTPPGPPTDFGIAFVPVGGAGGQGIPAAMAGSWMSTNISPTFNSPGWELLPPSQNNPGFGFVLNGPEGETGFFKMFIPQSLIDLMSQLYGEPMTAADLALFNGNSQASVAVNEVFAGETLLGALVDINVVFSQFVQSVDDELDEASLQSYKASKPLRSLATVNKSLTVRRGLQVSLTASQTRAPKGSRVELFGWVKNGSPGEKVLLTSNAKPPQKGLVKWKRLTLDADKRYSAFYTVKNTRNFQTVYKKAKQKAKKSPKVKVVRTKK